MKVKALLHFFLLIISNDCLSQDNSKIYEQWQSNLYQAYQATLVKNSTEAIIKYKAAIELVNTALYDHAAYINTMDRVIVDHDIFTDIKSKEEILNDVIKRTEKLYGLEHQFTIALKGKLQLSLILKGELDLYGIYYKTLFELYEKKDETVLDTRVMVKELLLNYYYQQDYDAACEFAFQWGNLDDPEFKKYYYVAFHANNFRVSQYTEPKDNKNKLISVQNALFFIEGNEALKTTYELGLLESEFYLLLELNRLKDALGSTSRLVELYTIKYGKYSVELAFLHNEIAIIYERLEQSELAEISYKMANLIYDINGQLEEKNYKTIRDNFKNFLVKSENFEKVLEFYQKEIAAYDRLHIQNYNYLQSLKSYAILLEKVDQEEFSIENYKKIIDYCLKNQLLFTTYIDTVFDLAVRYKMANYLDKMGLLMEENRANLIIAQDETGYHFGDFYRALVIYFNKKKGIDEKESNFFDVRLVEDIDKAVNYYSKENADYLEYASLLNVKGVYVATLKSIEEGHAIVKANKLKLEDLGFTETDQYALTLAVLSSFSDIKGDTVQADLLTRESMESYINQGDSTSENYFTVSGHYAKLLIKEEKFEEAVQLIIKNYYYIIKSLEKELRNKSSSAQEFKLGSSSLDFLNEMQYYNYILKDKTDQLNNISIEAALLTKNLTLNVSSNIINKLRSLNIESINNNIEYYKKIAYKYGYLINLYSQIGTIESLKEIKDANDEIDKEYATLISDYFDNFNEPLLNLPNYKDIKLEKNTAYIDYIRTLDLEGKFTYLAYIYLPNTAKPTIINLGLEADLKKILSSGNMKQLNYDTRGSVATKTTRLIGKELYNMVWLPLESIINNYNKIYFSLTGILNTIPFSSLQDNSGNLLLDKFDLLQISSSGPLLSKEKEVIPNFKNLKIYGGINYDMEPNNQLKDRFSYLPGTMKEALSIQTILPEAELYTGYNADENSFRALDGNAPSVLHIATHGFYFDYEELPETKFGKVFKMDKNPLKRTGLLLANANEGINGVLDKRLENGRDGVLTSLEIALLDLRKTDLVVLSACETGLGDIDGNEGVYGLQRAFKMAGVKMLMMSLWEIPDKETQEFMTKFYSLCVTNSIRASFKATQKYMKELYKDQPEIWAAFILVE